jgi:hypothetical protein
VCRSSLPSLDALQAEYQSDPVQDLSKACSAKRSDSVDQARAIDGSDLAHVNDARAREVRFSFSKADVSGHRGQPKVRRQCGDDTRADRAAIEAIVLHDDRGPLSVRFGAAAAKVQPEDVALMDHHRSSFQSEASSSSVRAPFR